MFKAIGFISLVVTIAIIAVMAKNRTQKVPPIVNEVLPAEAGQAAPTDIKDVPQHVQKSLDRSIKKHEKAMERNTEE